MRTVEDIAYWNYRIVRRADGWFEMREIYYDKEHRPISWADPTPVDGEDVEDIKGDMESRSRALARPVLHEIGEKLAEDPQEKLGEKEER